ncbi:hypothetical protein AN416_01315 [Paraburkholderia caribensis]|nr:hypothetical protein AN416_01315 [Paraburkholderia caribensis]AUT50514.1 hypothetical protein C2L66_00710 [Paraburkholderia caribensis]
MLQRQQLCIAFITLSTRFAKATTPVSDLSKDAVATRFDDSSWPNPEVSGMRAGATDLTIGELP